MCLKGSYDWNLDILKDKKDWMCPSCLVIKFLLKKIKKYYLMFIKFCF